MPAKLRSRLNYSNVMATVAVFLALGGTSYALATGSVRSREIANNSVRSKDLRNNDVRGRDVRNGTIGTRDVGDGALLAADFKAGQLPAGERGAQGEPGQPATKLFAYIRDTGGGGVASVDYGSGVAGVTDLAGEGAYTVTFGRSLTNCVVQAAAGNGDPAGTSSATASFPFVRMAQGGPNSIIVSFVTHDGVTVDTSFLITAFC